MMINFTMDYTLCCEARLPCYISIDRWRNGGRHNLISFLRSDHSFKSSCFFSKKTKRSTTFLWSEWYNSWLYYWWDPINSSLKYSVGIFLIHAASTCFWNYLFCALCHIEMCCGPMGEGTDISYDEHWNSINCDVNRNGGGVPAMFANLATASVAFNICRNQSLRHAHMR